MKPKPLPKEQKIDINKEILIIRRMLEQLNDKVSYLSDNMSKARDEIRQLKEENTKKDEEIKCMQTRLDRIEQNQLESSVEISNIDLGQNENPKEKVLEIARASNFAIDDNEIIDAYGLKRKSKLVIKFASLNIKRVFMTKVRERKFRSSDISKTKTNDPKSSSKKIYINDQLTTKNRNLLWLTKNKAKMMNWRFVWVKDGKILSKKDETTKPTYIENTEDIENIK